AASDRTRATRAAPGRLWASFRAGCGCWPRVELPGAVTIVTGGGGGIGRALCRRFKQEGAAAVVVADINGDAAEAVAAELGGMAVVTDVTAELAVRELVERTVAAYGRVDVYCSNAGVAFGGGPKAPDDAWQQSWEVHVMAHVYAARAVLPGMLDRKSTRLNSS